MITKTATTTHLAQMLTHARAGTDTLFGLVRPEAFYERPIPERHRIIFYFGHLEAFDWNLLSQAAAVPSFSPEFDQLFAFGIDPKPGQTQQDERSDWPEIAEVQQYNLRVRQTLDDISNQISEQMLSIALEHRLMHAETFAYLLHSLSIDQKHIPSVAPLPQSAAPIQVMLEIPGGTVTLGQPRKDPYGHHQFGWDNEFESHEVSVACVCHEQVQSYEWRVSQIRSRRRQTTALLDVARGPVVLARHVERSAVAIGLAGLCHPGRGVRLCEPGAARDCPPKPSFIGPRTGRCTAKKNDPIRGAMTSRIAGGETSAGTDGILFP